jgi:hypothetical protein
MKTVYYHGIQNPRSTFWMGQDAPAEKAPAPRMGQAGWLPDLLQTGGTAFGQYESAQAAEDARKAAEAKAAAAAAQAQAAIAINNAQNANKIMGLEPKVFWGGLAVVATLSVVGVVVANKKG